MSGRSAWNPRRLACGSKSPLVDAIALHVLSCRGNVMFKSGMAASAIVTELPVLQHAFFSRSWLGEFKFLAFVRAF